MKKHKNCELFGKIARADGHENVKQTGTGLVESFVVVVVVGFDCTKL